MYDQDLYGVLRSGAAGQLYASLTLRGVFIFLGGRVVKRVAVSDYALPPIPAFFVFPLTRAKTASRRPRFAGMSAAFVATGAGIYLFDPWGGPWTRLSPQRTSEIETRKRRKRSWDRSRRAAFGCVTRIKGIPKGSDARYSRFPAVGAKSWKY
ncbi:hypothetical protein K438DRAFT_2075195 [Mycena galopus ATCC 62051]|nr:hypothetical protein K438DRAFT_2075195 [Mycena galopus ATCC 62051]